MKKAITTKVGDCSLTELPRKVYPQGNLTFIEGGRHIPFNFKRIFYLYDVPTEVKRVGHAHKSLHQFFICLSGSFDVLVNDGLKKRLIHLNRPWKGLHVPPMLWVSVKNFCPGSTCVVLASAFFSESDYFRDYREYLRIKLSRGRKKRFL